MQLDSSVDDRLPLVMANAIAPLDALSALGDLTRRRIFAQLALGPASVGEIARHMPVSRSAVSQHLRVLKEAGLVDEVADGTRRIYRLHPHGVASVRDWLDIQWAYALGGLSSQESTKHKEKPE